MPTRPHPSSTFLSSNPRKLRWVRAACWQGALVAAGFLLTATVVGRLHTRFAFYGQGRVNTSAYLPPDPKDWFLAYEGGHLDHVILYHDLNDAVEKAKAADILILGNSTALFAFHDEELKRFSEETGLRVFNLAFGHAESAEFPNEILKNHDIRPKIILADLNFFFNGPSDYSRRVRGYSRLDAFKKIFEWSYGWRLRAFLQTYLPHWTVISPPTQYKPIFRSIERGTYYLPPVARNEGEIDPWNVSHKVPVEVKAYWLKRIQGLLSAMEAGGSKVIFTVAPSPGYGFARIRAEAYSKALSRPLVAPDIGKLFSCDGRHVDESTGRRFSSSLFYQLKRIPAVQEHMRRPMSFVFSAREALMQQGPLKAAGLSMSYDPMDLGEAFGLQMIVKPAPGQSAHAHIIGNHPGFGGHEGFVLQKDGAGEGTYVFGYGDGRQWIETRFEIVPGQWNYLAISVGGKSVRIYRNGALVASAQADSHFKNSAMPVMIGNWMYNDRPFNGDIFETLLGAEPLSGQEILRSWRVVQEGLRLGGAGAP